MRLLAFFISVISFSTMAEINSSHQLFFGENTPTVQSCGTHGRMLTSSEILTNIGQETLCRDVTSPWALWKIIGDNGSFWTMTGSGPGYNCDVKAGSNPSNQSLCVMRDDVPNNNVYIFESDNFKGRYPWRGQATVNNIGDEVTRSSMRSFKLGTGVQLIAYPENNFKGPAKVFTQSTNDTGYEVKSYKLKTKLLAENVTFSMISYSQYRVCLKLKASLSTNGLTSFCSEDVGGVPKVLSQVAEQVMQDTVAVYLEEIINPPYITTTYTGVIYLAFDGQGSFSLGHHVLPEKLSVTQDGNNLSFIYK